VLARDERREGPFREQICDIAPKVASMFHCVIERGLVRSMAVSVSMMRRN